MTNHRLLSAALLLAIAPLASQAAERAAELRYGLDEAAFRDANAEMMGKHMFVSDLSVANVGGKRTISAIWMHSEGFSLSAEAIAQAQEQVFLRQTAEEVQARFGELTKGGSQLAAIDAYDDQGTTYYATAYLPANQRPIQFVSAFLDDEQGAKLREEAQAKGMDLLRLDVAPDGDGVLYFPTYVLREDANIDAVQGDGEMQFAANRIKMDFAQMQPLSISAYRGPNGHSSFVGMFDNSGPRVLVMDKTLAKFRAEVDPMLSRGALAFDIDSYVEDGEVKYSAVLQPDS